VESISEEASPIHPPCSSARRQSRRRLANRLQQEGRVKDLEAELEKLDRCSLSMVEQQAWWHVYGIAAFQDGRDADALRRFKEAYEKFPDSAQIRFSLGQQYLRAHEVDRAFALFKHCRFPAISRDFALAQARYAYLWDRYDDGFESLRPFFDAYRELKILDDHFLYVPGLPFFGQWWSYLASFSILSGSAQELERVTRYVVENCHDYDFERLQLEWVAYREDRPELLIAATEKRLRGIANGFPTGYAAMNLAVAKGRGASSIDAAERILDAVKLGERDFRWLEDIRTLAKAEAARRSGHPELERERISAFFARQPMLFEPDIALNFHLLRYQEALKPRYRA
jgi:tetratricopeptide (TPR) repeat protein